MEMKNNICNICCENEAELKCSSCNINKFMCKMCFEFTHKSDSKKAHKAVPINAEDIKSLNQPVQEVCKCSKHNQERRYICKICDITVCSDCLVIGSHKLHEAVLFSAMETQMLAHIENVYQMKTTNIQKIEKVLKEINEIRTGSKSELAKFREEISNQFSIMAKQLAQAETELRSELDQKYEKAHISNTGVEDELKKEMQILIKENCSLKEEAKKIKTPDDYDNFAKTGKKEENIQKKIDNVEETLSEHSKRKYQATIEKLNIFRERFNKLISKEWNNDAKEIKKKKYDNDLGKDLNENLGCENPKEKREEGFEEDEKSEIRGNERRGKIEYKSQFKVITNEEELKILDKFEDNQALCEFCNSIIKSNNLLDRCVNCNHYYCRKCRDSCNLCNEFVCINCKKEWKGGVCKNCEKDSKKWTESANNLDPFTSHIFRISKDRNYDLEYYDVIQKKIINTHIQVKGADRLIQIRKRIFVLGGIDNAGIHTRKMREFTAINGMLLEKADMFENKGLMGICKLTDDSFCTVGGCIEDAKAVATCEEYHIEKNVWTKLPKLNESRIQTSCILVMQKTLYCFGGYPSKKKPFINHFIERLHLDDAAISKKWEIVDCLVDATGIWKEKDRTYQRTTLSTFQINENEIIIFDSREKMYSFKFKEKKLTEIDSALIERKFHNGFLKLEYFDIPYKISDIYYISNSLCNMILYNLTTKKYEIMK